MAFATERVAEDRQGAARDVAIKSARLDVAWSDAPLRQTLERLATAQGFTVVIDRRVDPEQPISITAKQETVDLILRRTAQQAGAGVSWVDSVAYLGPTPTAIKLRTLVELRRKDAGQATARVRRVLIAVEPQSWSEATVARELLVRACKLPIVNAEAIAHDLWPAGKLPRLRLTDQLSLWLAQFDATYELIDGDQVRIVPIPDRVSLKQTYPLGPQPSARKAAFFAAAPAARIEQNDALLTAEALFEEHEQFRALLRGQSVKKSQVTAGKQVYTLKFASVPLDRAIAQISQQLQRPIEFSDAAKLQLAGKIGQPISVDVRQATLAELLEAMLEPVGLTYIEKAGRITIDLPGR